MAEADALQSLISRAQQGDVRAFERLISSHLPKLRRFARAWAPSQADADDLAQEALVKVYKSLRSYRSSAAFSTWLFVVIRHAFLDHARSRSGRERSLEEPLEKPH